MILNDDFGIAVSAENSLGYVDPAYSGTLTLSLKNNAGNATFASVTATAENGVAVFDGLTLNKVASGYTFQISGANFATLTTTAVNVTSNPTPWADTIYAVPTDSSLRAAIKAADSNSFAFNTIVLSSATYVLTNATAGGLLIQNTSSLPSKTLTIVGRGQSSSIIEPGVASWDDRIFEVVSTGTAGITVVFQNLTINGGNATTGGILGGTAALGGALLIDGGTVSLTSVAVTNNQAEGAAGAKGAAGAAAQGGGAGRPGDNARGARSIWRPAAFL